MIKLPIIFCGVCFITVCSAVVLDRAFAVADGRNPDIVVFWQEYYPFMSRSQEAEEDGNPGQRTIAAFFFTASETIANAPALALYSVMTAMETGALPKEVHGAGRVSQFAFSLVVSIAAIVFIPWMIISTA